VTPDGQVAKTAQVETGACPAPPSVRALKIQQRDGSPDPEGVNKLPFSTAPRVPFTMTADSFPTTVGGVRGSTYLEDLGVRVPLKGGFGYSSIGRVACGWVVIRPGGPYPMTSDFGVLSSSGKYTSFGHLLGDTIALSPDGTELVYVRPTTAHHGEVRVMEVATGKEKAKYGSDEKTEVLGWNSAGIWFMPARDAGRTTLWRPGTAPVQVDTGGHLLTAYRTTDRLLLSDRVGAQADNCVRVAVLGASRELETLREKCGGSGGALSPDGKVLVFAGSTPRAMLVETGTVTRLDISSAVLHPDHGMSWEDATHLVQTVELTRSRVVSIRCDVTSGRCERISDGSWEPGQVAGPKAGGR
jgi:hypothetical protein